MNAALEFELLKARRASVFRWSALVAAVGVPALSTAFFQLVRLGGNSPSAAKAATMITELTLAGLLGTAGQVLSVAILMTAGIAASWSFGREFVDDALPALFAIATPRSSLAAAKFVVLSGWALLTVVSTVILTVIGGLLVGLDLDAAAVQTASRVAAAGLLGAALAAPMALISSWRRGYLPGIVALMAVVVVTQLVTAMGAGACVNNPAAATARGCRAGRRRNAQLVAARRGTLNADRLGIRRHNASNGTIYNAHTLLCPSLDENPAIRRSAGPPLAQAADSGKSTSAASDSVRRGPSSDALRRRSDLEAAAEAFTPLDQIVGVPDCSLMTVVTPGSDPERRADYRRAGAGAPSGAGDREHCCRAVSGAQPAARPAGLGDSPDRSAAQDQHASRGWPPSRGLTAGP